MMGHRLLLSSSRFRKVQHRLFLREYRRWNKEAKDTTWLTVVFQVAFFVAFYFGGKALGPNIIFVVIGLALLSGIAMFGKRPNLRKYLPILHPEDRIAFSP